MSKSPRPSDSFVSKAGTNQWQDVGEYVEMEYTGNGLLRMGLVPATSGNLWPPLEFPLWWASYF